LFDQSWVGTESNAALFDVGATDIQFKTRDAVDDAETFGHANIILNRLAGDIDKYGCFKLLDEGYFFNQESFQPEVSQANGVEHPGVCFDNTRGWIAFPRQDRNTFGDKSAQRANVHEIGQFIRIAAGAGCGEDGIFQRQACELDA